MSFNHANRADLAKSDDTSGESVAVHRENEPPAAVVERLDSFRSVTNDALGAVVVESGACLSRMSDGDRPGWLFDALTSADDAARVCAGCPVQNACLELELRLLGGQRHGMWGVLGEDGRRELHPVWAARRDDDDVAGGVR